MWHMAPSPFGHSMIVTLSPRSRRNITAVFLGVIDRRGLFHGALLATSVVVNDGLFRLGRLADETEAVEEQLVGSGNARGMSRGTTDTLVRGLGAAGEVGRPSKPLSCAGGDAAGSAVVNTVVCGEKTLTSSATRRGGPEATGAHLRPEGPFSRRPASRPDFRRRSTHAHRQDRLTTPGLGNTPRPQPLASQLGPQPCLWIAHNRRHGTCPCGRNEASREHQTKAEQEGGKRRSNRSHVDLPKCPPATLAQNLRQVVHRKGDCGGIGNSIAGRKPAPGHGRTPAACKELSASCALHPGANWRPLPSPHCSGARC